MKSIFILLMAFCLFTNASAQVNANNNTYPKTIDVTGSAAMEIIPDLIITSVELKEYEKRGTGKISLETIKTAFLENCKKIGIPDSMISIGSYEGNNNSYFRRRRKPEDLNASISYNIVFNNSKKMDELVALLDNEATQNFQIVGISHTRIIEFRKQMKIQAIRAAKEKAEYLCEAIKEKVGEAVTIEEGDDEVNQVSIANKRSNTGENAVLNFSAPSTIDFQKLYIRYEIKVSFAIK